MMIQFIFYTLLIIYCQKADATEYERIVKSDIIVNKINGLKHNSWKADSYGMKQIDVEEFAKTRLGAKLKINPSSPANEGKLEGQEQIRVLPTAGDNDGLPANFTWTNTNRTTCPIGAIRNQANCGSCWAVSSVSAFGDRLCIKSKGKYKEPLSSIHVVSCDKSNYGCYGGYMRNVYYFLKYNGTVTGGEYESDEGCQPYSIRPCGFPQESMFPCPQNIAWEPKCRDTKCSNEAYPEKFEKKLYKISSSYSVGSSYNEYAIRKEIYENGPVTAAFLVYIDFLFYKKGIYEHKFGWWPVGGHAVRVVGWGEENGAKYWTVANSWGTSWGEDGFFRIKRGVNMCYFESWVDAVTPIVD